LCGNPHRDARRTPQRDRKKGDQRVSLCCREKLWCWWSQGVGREAQG